MNAKIFLIHGVAALTCATLVQAAEPQAKVLVNRDRDGLAIQGYDAVAYFEQGKPVQGLPALESVHEGARYRFATAEHKRAFDAAPERYVPQYGGYCGYAASIDKLSPISPEWFQIVDGRLILQHNKKAYDLFNAALAENVVKADANWPGLVERNGTSVAAKRLINLDDAGVALQGYDPVAYFEQNAAVIGDPAQESVYDGARYHFASAEHRDTFERDPLRFIPAFGGYCGYAASINKISPVDPTIFQIIDGRLVLQHTPKAYALFNEDAPASLARADRNWPGLVAKKGHS